MTAPHIAAREPIPRRGEGRRKLLVVRLRPLAEPAPSATARIRARHSSPSEFKPEKDRTYFFCACKHSRNAPLCDGTHKTV